MRDFSFVSVERKIKLHQQMDGSTWSNRQLVPRSSRGHRLSPPAGGVGGGFPCHVIMAKMETGERSAEGLVRSTSYESEPTPLLWLNGKAFWRRGWRPIEVPTALREEVRRRQLDKKSVWIYTTYVIKGSPTPAMTETVKLTETNFYIEHPSQDKHFICRLLL